MFWKCWGYEPPSRDIGILGKIQYYHYRRQVPNAKTLFDFILEFSLFVWRWSAVYLFVQSPTMFHVDLSTGLAFTWIGQMFMIARRLYYYFTLPTLKCTFPMINGRVFVGGPKKTNPNWKYSSISSIVFIFNYHTLSISSSWKDGGTITSFDKSSCGTFDVDSSDQGSREEPRNQNLIVLNNEDMLVKSNCLEIV